MTKYLDPKNDFVFKRVFGEHKDLLVSFLNALMPLEPGQRIEAIEYLPPDLVPENPAKKLSIVDVRCMDNYGRLFIVEMQVLWTDSFYSRMEADVQCRQVSEDLLADEHIRKAVELCEESNFTEEELAIYDSRQNSIRIEKALNNSLKEGKKQGLDEGLKKGEAIGIETGKQEATEAIIQNARQNGLSIEQIQAFTGLSETDIENVISKPG
jgi:hypothetical protein